MKEDKNSPINNLTMPYSAEVLENRLASKHFFSFYDLI